MIFAITIFAAALATEPAAPSSEDVSAAIAAVESKPENEQSGAAEQSASRDKDEAAEQAESKKDKKKKTKLVKAEKDKAPRNVTITSERTDYDRKEGVIMFEGKVFVDDPEYKMHSDQLYVFLDGTNELKRIVAIGAVSITNETRNGSCMKATYTKTSNKVVMYGDGDKTMAILKDDGKKKSEVIGRKITFWTDTEQVEVEGSTVKMDGGGLGGKDGAKKLLGK